MPVTEAELKRRLSGGTLADWTLRDAGGVDDLPSDPVSDAVVRAQLNLTLSALRDAITGVGAAAKTLGDVVAAIQATQTVQGTVGVDNFPASQTVNGSVSVSNLPVTQPVSGTVEVDNFPATQLVSGPLTDTQLRAANVEVTVSNPTVDPETGLAKDINLSSLLAEFRNKYDVVQTATDTYTTSGDHDLIIPAPGQAVRSVWLYAQAKGALDTGTVLVTFTLGLNSYTFELTGSQPFAHGAVWEGAADEDLVVNTSSTAAVIVNVDYRVFVP